jgi:hypothetical protein
MIEERRRRRRRSIRRRRRRRRDSWLFDCKLKQKKKNTVRDEEYRGSRAEGEEQEKEEEEEGERRRRERSLGCLIVSFTSFVI